MPNCEIIINGITKNLAIDRPCFKFFKEKYLEILDTKNSLFLQNKFKNAIYNQLITYKIDKEKARLESEKLSDFNSMEEQESIVYPRYTTIGGKPLEEYVRFIINKKYKNLAQGNPSKKYPNFDNSCALCVSYAFNKGGMPIKNLCNLPPNSLKGEDENLYYTGVPKIKELLLNNWKNLRPYSKSNNKDFYKVFYRNKQEYFSIISNSTLLKQIRDENQKFFNILKSLNQNGIVTMDIDGWENAGGHSTFWDNENKHFLDKVEYLSDSDEKIFVRELCFWKI